MATPGTMKISVNTYYRKVEYVVQETLYVGFFHCWTRTSERAEAIVEGTNGLMLFLDPFRYKLRFLNPPDTE